MLSTYLLSSPDLLEQDEEEYVVFIGPIDFTLNKEREGNEEGGEKCEIDEQDQGKG